MFALLGFFAMLTVVPAFLAAGRLARRRRPVLTMIALGVNLVAYLGGWGVAALDNMYLLRPSCRWSNETARRPHRRDVV